jgi:branched-chain amino acid transport system substrate-binding protein
VVVGFYQSGVAVPASLVTERLKTALLVTDGTADEITDRNLKYLFKIDTKADIVTRQIVQAVKWFGQKMNQPVTKVALLDEDSAFGQAMKERYQQNVVKEGLTIADDISFKTGAVDLSPQAARIKASGANWTVGSWYIDDQLNMVKNFPALGVNHTRLTQTGGGFQDPSLLKVGAQAEGGTGVTMWNPDLKLPGVKELAAKFKQRTNTDMTQNGAKAYAGIWIIKDVLERAASVDKDKIRDAFAKTDITSSPAMVLPAKRIAFDATGQMQPTHIGIQVQNGAFVTVWPEELASAPLDTTKLSQGMVSK